MSLRCPFEIDIVGPAKGLDLASVLGLEDRFPIQIEAFVIIPDIAHAPALDLVQHVTAERTGHGAHIRDRGLPTGLGRLDAAEYQPQRPIPLVGILAVHKDFFRRRILGRRHDPLEHFGTWGRAIHIIRRPSDKQVPDGRKVGLFRYPDTAKDDNGMCPRQCLDGGQIVGNP